MLRMIECNNPTSVGNRYVGTKGIFQYNGNNFTFGSMYSSTVKSIVRDEDKLIVQTLNTKYTFSLD